MANLSTSATIPIVNQLASRNTSGSLPNNIAANHRGGTLSFDAKYYVYSSSATDIVTNDNNAKTDIFIFNRLTGSTQRVNVTPSGGEADDTSGEPNISYGGRYVVFSSEATNLTADAVPGDVVSHVFIRDLQTNETRLVSTNSTGAIADRSSGLAVVSADGRFVAFLSRATNLVSGVDPTVYGQQVFLKDMLTGGVQALSVNSSGQIGNQLSIQPSMSCGGKVVAFVSSASNLVPGDTNNKADVFVSRIGWSGNLLSNITIEGNESSSVPSVSCDGNKIAFQTNATTFPSGHIGTYAYDRLSGAKIYVSRDTSGAIVKPGSVPTISNDGRFVAFESTESFDSADTNGDGSDIYVRDLKNNTTQLVSRNSTGAVGRSSDASISPDGSHIVYNFVQTSNTPYGYLTGTTYMSGVMSSYLSETGF